jgi:hypothetical protein
MANGYSTSYLGFLLTFAASQGFSFPESRLELQITPFFAFLVSVIFSLELLGLFIQHCFFFGLFFLELIPVQIAILANAVSVS